MRLTYAAAVPRDAPPGVRRDAEKMAGWLASHGWALRSEGGECPFLRGAPEGMREMLPRTGDLRRATAQRAVQAAMSAVARRHPSWDECQRAVRVMGPGPAVLVLGAGLDSPAHALACWTRDGAAEGPVGIAMSVAAASGVPVMNLGAVGPREACEAMARIEREAGLG